MTAKDILFRIALLTTHCFGGLILTAQVNVKESSTPPRPDTLKIIQIISAGNMRQITVNDSTVLETLAGKAVVKHENTILHGDSIVIHKRLGTVEVFGNLHIIDSNSVHTYAQYLKYLGKEKIAYLKKNVRLSDGKSQLYTNDLEYNLATGIAIYKGGGKVITEKTTLTSNDGIYYAQTKDIFFKNNVRMKDPKYTMTADSLQYNSEFKTAYFISPTTIVSNEGVIETSSGSYNIQTGEALFYDNPVFRDKKRYIRGNKMAFDEKTGIIQIEGNGKVVDTEEKVIVLGNQILINKKNNSFLATRKPVMIFYKDRDSTYISADTLFSGKNSRKIFPNDKKDTLRNTSLSKIDSVRFFNGFHNVKIFNDSLQAVSDSLYYSTEDSTFKLMNNPVCWNNSSQVKGDTINLLIQNQKAKELKVINNAILINQTKEGFFNQVAGRYLEAIFINGNIDKAFVKGSPVQLLCKYVNEYYLKENDCIHIIASIEAIYADEKLIQKDNWLQLDKGNIVAINGLDGYALPKLIDRFEY
ncbi:MAG: hypothetical protein FGM46_07830, partial [Ferruginibacter sp.]|nr:hypothetical protein [Ferruginibacter sp.]